MPPHTNQVVMYICGGLGDLFCDWNSFVTWCSNSKPKPESFTDLKMDAAAKKLQIVKHWRPKYNDTAKLTFDILNMRWGGIMLP